jgi:hypothetical protein
MADLSITRAPNEFIDWTRCDGIEHVFYDNEGNVIYERQFPAPRAAKPGPRKTDEAEERPAT